MVLADAMVAATRKIRMNFHLDPEDVEGLDALRRDEPGPLPSRAELVRRLIRRALAARAKAKQPKEN